MVAGALVDTTASIVQLRHEILVAGDQKARAAARNAAVVYSVHHTLSATVAAQRRRRMHVDEEQAKHRLFEQQCESDALRTELEDVLERRERARAEFDAEVRSGH